MARTIKLCTEMTVPLELREEANLHAIEVNPANAPQIDPLAPLEAAMDTKRRWPLGATLRVHFVEGDPAVHRRVEPIAHEWSQYANIKLAFVADPNAEIRVAFNPAVGSWSYMGTDCSLPALNGKPTMNLGWLKPGTAQTEYRRVVLHEFGHALGLIHEHLSPAATIPWDEQKVINPGPYQWLVFDLNQKRSTVVPIDANDPVHRAFYVYGSIVRDNQGRFYVVGGSPGATVAVTPELQRAVLAVGGSEDDLAALRAAATPQDGPPLFRVEAALDTIRQP